MTLTDGSAATACLEAFLQGDMDSAARFLAGAPEPHGAALATVALFLEARRRAAAGDAAVAMVGGPSVGPWTYPTRSHFTATLRDVIVSSRSNYVLAGAAAVLDALPHELALCPLDHDVDPMILYDDPPGSGDRPALPPPGRYPERLFLSRKPHQHRKLLNQAEVIDRLATKGFEAAMIVGAFDRANPVYADKSSYRIEPHLLDSVLTAMPGKDAHA